MLRLWISCGLFVALCAAGCGDGKRYDDDDDDDAGESSSGGKSGAGGKGSGGVSGSSGEGTGGGEVGGSSATGGDTATGGVAAGGATGGGTQGGATSTGGTGGDTGSGGMSGSAPIPMSSCNLDAIEVDSTLNWDVKPVTVSGVITVNGAPMPDSPDTEYRGIITFRDQVSGKEYGDAIDPTGDGIYSRLLFAGDYEVIFEAESDAALVGMPYGKQKQLAANVTIGSDQTLDYDLVPITVSGTITVHGGVMPDSADTTYRGIVWFRDLLTGDYSSASVPPTGAAEYSRLLFAGDYDVSFETTDETGIVGLPRDATTWLESGVAITADRTLDYDVKPVTVGGTVTVAGGVMPDSPDLDYRGSVWYRDLRTNDYYSASVPGTGAATYSTLLFTGDYDVEFQTTTETALVGLPPGRDTHVGSKVSVTGDQTFDYDVLPVTVSGTLSVNGGVMPESPDATSRGTITLRDQLTGEEYANGIAVTGAASYSRLIFAGNYDVSFETPVESELVGMPYGAGTRLGSGVAIEKDQALDFDLGVATVSGIVSLNGAPMPDSPDVTSRGTITFIDQLTGAGIEYGAGTTGEADYSRLVFTGTYDVDFDAANESGLVGLPYGGSTRLASNVEITGDQALDFDLKAVTVSGGVTMNGGPLTDSPDVESRGSIEFRDKITNHSYAYGFGPIGEATYSRLIFAGGFDVSFTAGSESGLMGLPYGGISTLAYGCLPMKPCSADAADLSGTWTLYFDQSFFGPLTLDLTQDGQALAGPYHAPTYSGTMEGTRTGNELVLRSYISSSCNPLELKAVVGGSCLLEGSATCGGYPSYRPHFTGTR